jgi:hypothetical protein
LLARHWRLVQRLSSDGRQNLALALVSRMGTTQLDRLFARDAVLSREEITTRRFLERLGIDDPRKLRELTGLVRRGPSGAGGLGNRRDRRATAPQPGGGSTLTGRG